MTGVSTGAKIWIALWVVYIVWGSTYLGIELAGETMPGVFAAGVRFTTVGLLDARVRRLATRAPERLRVRKGRAGVGRALSDCCSRARTRSSSSPSRKCRSG